MKNSHSRRTGNILLRPIRWSWARTVMFVAPVVLFGGTLAVQSFPPQARAGWIAKAKEWWPLNRKVQTVFDADPNCITTTS